jgi:hypothetical protein
VVKPSDILPTTFPILHREIRYALVIAARYLELAESLGFHSILSKFIDFNKLRFLPYF